MYFNFLKTTFLFYNCVKQLHYLLLLFSRFIEHIASTTEDTTSSFCVYTTILLLYIIQAHKLYIYLQTKKYSSTFMVAWFAFTFFPWFLSGAAHKPPTSIYRTEILLVSHIIFKFHQTSIILYPPSNPHMYAL